MIDVDIFDHVRKEFYSLLITTGHQSAGHGTRTHDLWVASPVPYPFLHEISYWNSWKFTYINTYQTFVVWYKIFAIENLFFNPDAKYLQLKIYFSIQMQKNCKLVIGIQDFAKTMQKNCKLSAKFVLKHKISINEF